VIAEQDFHLSLQAANLGLTRSRRRSSIEKPPVNGLATLAAVFTGCSQMLNDAVEIVKSPLTAI
jgi:hypothetical protein